VLCTDEYASQVDRGCPMVLGGPMPARDGGQGRRVRRGAAARVPRLRPTGRQAESALLDAGVVTNRNAVPRDPNGAWYTSGVRLGTPALTTRGLGEVEMDEVAALVMTVLEHTQPDAASRARYRLQDGVAEQVRARAADLLAAHPLYPGLQLYTGSAPALAPGRPRTSRVPMSCPRPGMSACSMPTTGTPPSRPSRARSRRSIRPARPVR